MGGDVHFAGETSLAHFSPDHFQLHFNLMAETEKFQNIVKRLQLTRWSIPAPFNQVDGKLGCTLSGKYLGRAERGSVPVKCFVNLKSANQTYKLNSQGVIELRTENSQFIPRLELLTELDDIKIPIPDLKITEPAPNLVKDKRFVDYNSIIEKPNFKIEYDIKIASKASDAIKVVTNLALDPVPFAVTAHLTHDKPAIGEINFSAFRIGILRREIKVENFRIKLQPDPAKQEITGLVQFKTSDFKVYMDIFGTLEKPLYSFRSVPALPEKDILAVVFFGKTLGELDFDQQKSVDQSEAAFASGVIGLISMYYLSSTPIESISYNPLTNTVAAKFAVREGLSLTIGANTESEGQIGLRQSLGRGWSMESTAIHDDASGLNRGVAMLRWALRY